MSKKSNPETIHFVNFNNDIEEIAEPVKYLDDEDEANLLYKEAEDEKDRLLEAKLEQEAQFTKEETAVAEESEKVSKTSENASENDDAIKSGRVQKEDNNPVIDEIEERRRHRKKKLKRPGFFTQIGIAVGVIALLIAISLSSLFTVDSIEVQGNKYFTDEEIINMAHASTGHNILYKLDKRHMLKYLRKNPYIAEAKVYRSLPSTVVINVKERKQIAALTYGNHFLIMDKEGILLRSTKTKPKITIITGFKISKFELGERIEVSDEKMFDDMLALLNSMEKGDVYFKSVNASDLFVTAYVYDSLQIRSKYKELKLALDKGRLKKVLQELFNRNIKRGTVTITEDGYASFTPEF